MDFEAFDSGFKKYFSFLENQYVSGALSILLILYASSVAPKLPEGVAKLLDNIVVRAVVFFLIVYLTQKNATLALIVSIVVLVSLMALSRNRNSKEMMDDLQGDNIQVVNQDMPYVKRGMCYACKCGGRSDCPLRENCPCYKMMHQMADYVKDREPFTSVGQEIMDKGSVIVNKGKELVDKVKELVLESPEQKPEMPMEPIVRGEQPVMGENIVFDEESLMALREKVSYRQQNNEVTGRDEEREYALV
jgi:hypothetical protein